MQRTFFSNLILMIVLNLLVKPAAIFGIDAEIQNRVGSADYGLYFSLLNFSFLFNILLDFGINNFTTKSVAQYPKAALSYLGKIMTFRLILFVFYVVVSLSVATIIGWGKVELSLLGFLLLNQFFVTLIAYARSHFGGLHLFKTEALISVLDRFLLIIFCGILLYTPISGGVFKIEWFIWIQSVCYGITFLVAFSLLLRKIGLPKIKHRNLFSYALIRQSFPYALLILLMMIYTRLDSVMIERIHENGKMEAGYYAQGFRLLDAFFMFAMIFSNLLFPMFSRMLGNQQNVQPLLNSAGKLLIGGAILIGIFSFYHSEEILGWIYDHDIFESKTSFQLLMFSFTGMCSVLIFGTLLTAHGSLKFLNTVSAIGIVINIGLNTYFIPEFGAKGAAFATLITQSIVALTQIIFVIYHFEIKPNWLIFLQFTGFIGVGIGFNMLFPIGFTWSFITILSLQIISLFIFRLIDLRELKNLVKSAGTKEIVEG